MTQEDKQLLLKDLCARLSYGVKIKLGDYDYQVCGYNSEKEMPVKIWYYYDSNLTLKSYIDVYLTDYHPYLRPMSSMTEEEREDFWWNVLDMDWREDLCLDDDLDEEMETAPFPFMENGCGFYLDNFYLHNSYAVIDWLNEHHFDYRGLIEKGLALEAPEGMYKTEEQL